MVRKDEMPRVAERSRSGRPKVTPAAMPIAMRITKRTTKILKASMIRRRVAANCCHAIRAQSAKTSIIAADRVVVAVAEAAEVVAKVAAADRAVAAKAAAAPRVAADKVVVVAAKAAAVKAVAGKEKAADADKVKAADAARVAAVEVAGPAGSSIPAGLIANLRFNSNARNCPSSVLMTRSATLKSRTNPTATLQAILRKKNLSPKGLPAIGPARRRMAAQKGPAKRGRVAVVAVVAGVVIAVVAKMPKPAPAASRAIRSPAKVVRRN